MKNGYYLLELLIPDYIKHLTYIIILIIVLQGR